jgi:hypothetical protein
MCQNSRKFRLFEIEGTRHQRGEDSLSAGFAWVRHSAPGPARDPALARDCLKIGRRLHFSGTLQSEPAEYPGPQHEASRGEVGGSHRRAVRILLQLGIHLISINCTDRREAILVSITFWLCAVIMPSALLQRETTGKQRVRAFVKTLLLYALVGPLVGLVSLLPIAVLVAAWDLVADWLRGLISRAQSPPCDPPHDGIFDLRCFQQVAPFHFNLHIDGIERFAGNYEKGLEETATTVEEQSDKERAA